MGRKENGDMSEGRIVADRKHDFQMASGPPHKFRFEEVIQAGGGLFYREYLNEQEKERNPADDPHCKCKHISDTEAIAILLGWGYSPEDAATKVPFVS